MQNKESQRLRECPFCGGKAVDVVEDDNVYLHLRYQVFCGRCGASSGRHHTKQKATEAWNRRYAEPKEIEFDYEAED